MQTVSITKSTINDLSTKFADKRYQSRLIKTNCDDVLVHPSETEHISNLCRNKGYTYIQIVDTLSSKIVYFPMLSKEQNKNKALMMLSAIV